MKFLKPVHLNVPLLKLQLATSSGIQMTLLKIQEALLLLEIFLIALMTVVRQDVQSAEMAGMSLCQRKYSLSAPITHFKSMVMLALILENSLTILATLKANSA